MSTPTNLTISGSDIAQLAGVGRSTVSNWRARHDDFPKPVAGSATSPRFDTAEVRAWLQAHGKDVKDLAAGQMLWSALDIWRNVARLEEMGGFTSALLTWRYVSDPDSSGFDDTLPSETWWPHLRDRAHADDLIERIHSGMRAYEVSHPEHGPLFEAFMQGRIGNQRHDSGRLWQFINALSQFKATSIGEAFVSFQDRLTNSVRRGYDEYATSTTLVDLVAAVARSVPGRVHDPVAGSGRMLLAVGDQGESREVLTGQDINAEACAQANQRALVTGHHNVTVRQGDVFLDDHFDRGLAQVVVMDPPYGLSHRNQHLYVDPRLPYGPPPKSSLDTAWLQLALWYLGPQGRAFILQPPASAYQGGAVGRIRAAMLQHGTVEAVVALPGGLASQTQIPLNLWVLARPGEVSDPGRVLLIDHSHTKDIDIDAIAEALQSWREHRVVPTKLPAGAFTVADILTDESDLTPKRWISSAEGIPDVEEVRSHVEALHRAVAETKPLDKLTAASLVAGKQTPKLVTVSDLVKAGRVTALKANERIQEAAYSTEGTPVVTGAWIRGDEAEPRRINLSVLEHTPVITQPGDVLVQNTGGLAARVDTEGGRVLLSPSFQLLRLTNDVMRPQYLAEALVSRSNQRQAVGAAIQRIRLKDMKVPLLTLDEQDRVVERIAEIRRLQASARAVLQSASATRDDLVEAVTAGTVEIH